MFILNRTRVVHLQGLVSSETASAYNPSAVLPWGTIVCYMQVCTWLKHGWKEEKLLSHFNQSNVFKHLSAAGNPIDHFTMCKEAALMGDEDFMDVLGAQFVECLQDVHQFCEQCRSQRLQRELEAGYGPKSIANRKGPLEVYVAGHLSVFKFDDSRLIQEELRGVNPQAIPSASSENKFRLALQSENTRMMNWVACWSLPIDERHAVSSHFGNYLHHDRVNFAPSSFVSNVSPANAAFRLSQRSQWGGCGSASGVEALTNNDCSTWGLVPVAFGLCGRPLGLWSIACFFGLFGLSHAIIVTNHTNFTKPLSPSKSTTVRH